MPEAVGGPEYGSIVAPYIGAAFEGSRILRKVIDIRTGIPEVPVYKVEDKDARELWAFRNIHAYSEYTSPITAHWYQAAQDWVLDIRTASSAGKIDPTDSGKKKRIPLNSDERRGAVDSEKLIKAMIAVTASAKAMETSAGAMEKYVEALVGGDADRAETWSEFLVHGQGGKEKVLILRRNPAVQYFYHKLLLDAFDCETDKNGRFKVDGEKFLKDKEGKLTIPNPGYNLPVRKDDGNGNFIPREGEILKFLRKKPFGGGMREYVFQHLIEKSDVIREPAIDCPTILEDGEIRVAAAKVATDLFLVDEYTQWEYNTEKKFPREKDGEKEKRVLWPSENWGGNPLRAVIEPSFLPRKIKNMYRGNEQILDWVDDAFTFNFKIPENLSDGEKDELKQQKKACKLEPTMTSPLKALNRYGQALMTLFGGSTAPGLPVLNDRVFSGKESITNIWELMNQVVGDGDKDKSLEEDKKVPFGKNVMGWFTAKVLYIKAVAAVRQFVEPSTFELSFSPDDQRSLRKVAEIIFGTRLKGEAGILRETASGRLGFKYKTNRIPGVAEIIEQTKNILLLGGEHGKEAAYLKRFFQVTFGVAAVVSGGGGRKK